MASILLCLSEENSFKTASEVLATTKHTVLHLNDLPKDDLSSVVSQIVENNADVVVIDYWTEDAASVKLMQTINEMADRPEFIFIEMSSTDETEREQVLMALNEGAQAFLPNNFQAPALLNYIERAVSGPSRLRLKLLERTGSEVIVNNLEETIGTQRTKINKLQQVIAYLLSTPGSSQNRKTLVVSDSPYQLEILKKILDDHNIPTLTASNPVDGLQVALDEKPQIIVSDLELEGQTGIEFCQTIKFTHKMTPLHFIICTANQDKIPTVMTPGNGVDDCVIKPSGQSDAVDFISRVALGFQL